MRRANTIRWVAVSVLLAVLAVPAIVVTVGRLTVVEVDGRSMEPAIRYGDVVVIREPTPDDFTPGTIVTAEDSTGAKYTHRITGLTPDGALLLKGDNNTVDDPAPVSATAVVGVVAAHLHGPAAPVVIQLQSWPLRVCVLAMILGLVFLPISSSAPEPRLSRNAQSASKVGRRPTGRRRSHDTHVPALNRPTARTTQSNETLALIDAIQSSIAGVLLASERNLTGQYIVRTKPGSTDFSRVQMLIEIADKNDTPQPARTAGTGLTGRTIVPAVADASELLYARTSGSIPADLPTRRSQRIGTRHGRRRAGGRR